MCYPTACSSCSKTTWQGAASIPSRSWQVSRKRGAAPALLLLIRVPGSSGPFSAADRCAGHCCARHSHSPPSSGVNQ